MLFLLACAEPTAKPADSADTGAPVECLDTRPAYAGCAAEGEEVGSGLTTTYAVEWDDAGNEVRRQARKDSDGMPVYEYVQTWDDADHLLAWTYGEVGEEPEITAVYTWEGDLRVGREVRYVGMPMNDNRVVYAYDADGQLLREELDAQVDGTVDAVTTYTWEADRLVREETSGSDGAVEQTCDTTWSLYGTGDIATRVCSDADGTPISSTVTTYDLHGAEVSVRQDADADGRVDATEEWDRDDRCLVRERYVGRVLDGVLYEASSFYAYDDAGRLTTEEGYDWVYEGHEATTSWSYTCP